jgi:hypothetical protein
MLVDGQPVLIRERERVQPSCSRRSGCCRDAPRTAVACAFSLPPPRGRPRAMPWISISAGPLGLQRALACGQRGWKAQPLGGFSGLGTSPCTGVRARPVMWMSGIASSSMRVYGCAGGEQRAALSASSTSRPRYITPTWSADVAHHRQVVADEQVGQALLALQVLHDVQHLRLHRHVQRRGRLVADQELGLVASARAIEMRWRWPPENWCGNFSTSAAARPTDCSSSPTGAQLVGAARPGRARAAARRRCRAPSSAGSGWHRGPGRSSACAGAGCASGRARRLAVSCRRSAPAARRRVQARPAAAPPCSCRSPIRPPAPASAPGRWRS